MSSILKQEGLNSSILRKSLIKDPKADPNTAKAPEKELSFKSKKTKKEEAFKGVIDALETYKRLAKR